MAELVLEGDALCHAVDSVGDNLDGEAKKMIMFSERVFPDEVTRIRRAMEASYTCHGGGRQTTLSTIHPVLKSTRD